MGMEIRTPQLFELQGEQPKEYVRIIRENKRQSTQMVLCVLSSNRKDRYDAIKKECCVNNPVPSQCVLSRTLSKQKMLMSVATKIAIQLNCKLGGEVWALGIPLNSFMVIGIDTYHDSAKKGRSVGGFVASMNKNLTLYHSKTTFQTNMQELSDGLRACMTSSLQNYHRVNGHLPDKVCVFRDGVGDGQLPTVVDHEIPQLLDTFKAMGDAYNPAVTFVVVKKRVNARFFARAGQGLANPPPGTVIDTEVTKPEWLDFYLVSQSVRQGTVTPTHYNIVLENMNLGMDKIQRLSYKLTHLYYNWPGTIRVPAPCQYAHKLAFLVGQSLHEEPHAALADKLYYL